MVHTFENRTPGRQSLMLDATCEDWNPPVAGSPMRLACCYCHTSSSALEAVNEGLGNRVVGRPTWR